MNYTWNVMISLLLSQFIVSAQSISFKEEILVSSSNNISCDRNTTIRIVDLKVQQYTTSCQEIKHCNLTDQQRSDIKISCNEKRSCTISTIIPNSCVVNDYGHVSVLYSCTGIVNSSCTFENGMCGWTIDGSNNYKWTRQSGKSPESNTGPDRDHTTASENGHYMSTVSYKHANENAKSDLFSGFIVSSPKQCLTFWYHMYGKEIKTLEVFQRNSEYTIDLWSKSYSQGNKWYFQSLTLKDMGHYRIQFKATRGDGDESEIAVDDIVITNTVCKKASDLDCSFEVENCSWSLHETPFNWKITEKPLSLNEPGPHIDRTTGTAEGHYIYLKRTDLNVQEGDKFNLTSITVNPNSDSCFTFWYHLYGENIGTLNVYTESGNNTEKCWSRSGNHGDNWLFANFDISKSEPYNIIFEGVYGDYISSDIALDDIQFLQRTCSDLTLDCSFEESSCYWSNYPETPYIWSKIATPISTDSPGPYTDHTTGSDGGHYIYLQRTGSKHVKYNLISHTIIPNDDTCFTFWYHMYGLNIGTLSVYTKSGNTTEMHWSQSGNHENSWQFAHFDISKSKPYSIIFEGTRGNDGSSDIALDDILLHQRSCSGSIKYSQLCHKTTETISLHECSKYYLQLNKTSLEFNPKCDDCFADYQDVQTSIKNLCNDINYSDICTFNLSDVTNKEFRCFQSNRLLIEYTCEAEETTSVSSIVESAKSTSEDQVTTTVPHVVVYTVSDTGVSLPTVLKTSSESATGLIVGLVIGGLLLACLVIFIVIFVRRQTFGNGSKEKVRNNLHEHDYIGCQDIALPQAADHSGLMTFADTQTLNDDEYAIINPSAETSCNEVISDGNRTADSYMILDPNDTGFNRTQLSNTPGGYQFEKPVRHIEKNNGDEDQYAVSDGVYDHSGNNRHKELEDNIYNHAVDTVYDSGSHMRNNAWREDTYDHFHGQQTEDDYDISTTT